MTRTAVSAKQDHPQRGSRGNSPLASRGAKTLIKRPKRVEYTSPKGISEAGFSPLLRQQLHEPECCYTTC